MYLLYQATKTNSVDICLMSVISNSFDTVYTETMLWEVYGTGMYCYALYYCSSQDIEETIFYRCVLVTIVKIIKGLGDEML